MKIAICGLSPTALKAASYFLDQGAQIRIFDQNFEKALSLYDDSVPSKLDYLRPLIKKAKIKRVHKRFLNKGETINNHSRLHDLFRVVYEFDAKSSLEKQKQESPEAFKDLDETIVKSLSDNYEAFEDFDFVLDCLGPYENPLPIGPSQTFALNEQTLNKSEAFFYGASGLAKLLEKLDEIKNIAIVGSGHLGALALSRLQEWLDQSNERSLTLLTEEEQIFHKFFQESGDKDIKESLSSFLNERKAKFEQLAEKFQQEINHYKSLEPHEKTKVSPPKEPRDQFEVFYGVNVTSVDRLIDRDGMFLTFEKPDFRESNLEADVKTLGADAVLVVTGHSETRVFQCLNKEEPGCYTLPFSCSEDEFDKSLNAIFKDMCQYFSKA